MTTASLLLLLVVVGVPAWVAVTGPPGWPARLRDRLLQTTSSDQVRAGVEENDELYRFARKSFEKASQTTKAGAQVDPTATAEIAAVNVFVEKAQIQLRQRALWCGIGAAACVLMDVMVAVVALLWLTGSGPVAGGWEMVALWTLRASVLAALSFGLVYLFTSLARQLFAAASAALEKRHSLGFGRLYVQMKVLAAPDPRRATRALTDTELLRAFGWEPPPPPPAEEAPVRTLVLPPRSAPAVRTLGPARPGPARGGDETKPSPAA
jgi:hypothetical protein